MRVAIAGAGVFGLTAAVELRRRGHDVRLFDAGPVPHPLAASTDISKVVRLEYGADGEYTALAEQSIEGWRRWNRDFGETVFHQTGVLFLRRTPLANGTLEQDSFDTVSRRGHGVQLLDAEQIRKRFPAWNAERYPYGIFDPEGGYAESGRTIAHLARQARALGVQVVEGAPLTEFEKTDADALLAALGAWTPHALPWLAHEFRSTGHPVFHLAPREPQLFAARQFPVFCADISSTGWYGFPLHPREGVVKVAQHGAGRVMHPESPERVVNQDETQRLRAFLAETFPALADARIAFTRICLYCDSQDGHFRIARDPRHPRLFIAAGDSGHAFKFAPALGALSADAIEGRANPLLAKFAWRPGAAEWQEASRQRGSNRPRDR